MSNKKPIGKAQQLRHHDELLWRKVKAAAVMEGKTMTEWVEEAIRMRFTAAEKSGK